MSSDLADWTTSGFGERNTAQRRRILTSTRVTAAGDDASVHYSTAACRTENRDALVSPASVAGNAAAANRQDRRSGANWRTSPGLHAALHQSGTTMRDAAPMQRDITSKVVVERIQQPKAPEHKATTVIRLTGTRVRGIGMTAR